MIRAYAVFLRLYPAEHREVFAAEMQETFEHAVLDCRKRGAAALAIFAAREFFGLVRGLFTEWFAKATANHTYLTSLSGQSAALPDDVPGMQIRLARLIASMEFAIAHHDFPKARYYSSEERIARAQLQRMLSEAEAQNPPAAIRPCIHRPEAQT
jgi:hypothetical protein